MNPVLKPEPNDTLTAFELSKLVAELKIEEVTETKAIRAVGLMDQIVFFGFALSLFWLSVISVVVCLTLLRIRRLQQLEYAYLREAYAQAKKTPSSLATSTREHPIVRSQPLTLQSFKHTNPSEHVSLAIEPDESPTRIEVHVKRIIKHLQADKRSIG